MIGDVRRSMSSHLAGKSSPDTGGCFTACQSIFPLRIGISPNPAPGLICAATDESSPPTQILAKSRGYLTRSGFLSLSASIQTPDPHFLAGILLTLKRDLAGKCKSRSADGGIGPLTREAAVIQPRQQSKKPIKYIYSRPCLACWPRSAWQQQHVTASTATILSGEPSTASMEHAVVPAKTGVA